MEEHRSPSDDPEQRWYPGERAYRAPGWDSVDMGLRVPEPRISPLGADAYGPVGDGGALPPPDRHAEPWSRRGAHADGAHAEGVPLEAVLPQAEGLRDPLGSSARAGLGRGGYPDPDPAGGPSPASPFEPVTGMMPVVPAAAPGEEPVRATGAPRFHSERIERSSLRRSNAPTEPVGDGVYRTRRPAVALLFTLVTLILAVPAARLLLDAALRTPVYGPGVVSGVLLLLGLPIFAAGCYAMVTSGRAAEDRGALLRPPLGYLSIGLILFLAAGLAAA